MMHKSLYSHLPVVDHSGHSVGVVDIVKLSMHLHDLISKVLPSIHPSVHPSDLGDAGQEAVHCAVTILDVGGVSERHSGR